MDGESEDSIVHLAIDPVELLLPQILDVARIHEAVAVWRLFYEHHRRQVIRVPIGANLDEVDLLAVLEWMHPLLRLLGIIDDIPVVADSRVEGLEVAIALAMVVSEAIFLQQRRSRGGHLPPGRHVAPRSFARQLLNE